MLDLKREIWQNASQMTWHLWSRMKEPLAGLVASTRTRQNWRRRLRSHVDSVSPCNFQSFFAMKPRISLYIYFHLCFKIRRKIQADLRNFIINNEQLVSEIFSYKERNQINYSNVVSFIKTSMACEMNKDAAPLPTTDVMHLLKCVISVARSEAGQSGLS